MVKSMSLCALLAGMNRIVLVYGAPATALRFCAESRQLFSREKWYSHSWPGTVDCVCLLMQKLKFSFLALMEHIKFVDRREGEMGKVSTRRKGGRV